MPDHDLTYTAKWSGTYVVEVYQMNTDGTYPTNRTSYTLPQGAAGETIKLTAADIEIPEGFELDTTNSVLEGTVTPNQRTSLKIYLARKEYTVSWSFGSGVDCTVENDGAYTTAALYGAPIVAPKLKKSGYNYKWNPTVPATMPAENLSFTAQWTEKNYELWIGGVEVTARNEEDIFDNGKASFRVDDSGTQTLTLNGYTYTGNGTTDSTGEHTAALLYLGTEPLVLELAEGTVNSLICTADDPNYKNDGTDKYSGTSGIYSVGDLTITGTGELTVKGGEATTAVGGFSFGMHVADLNIGADADVTRKKGPTLYIYADDATAGSYGIYNRTNSGSKNWTGIGIDGYSYVYVEAADANESYGINSLGTVYVGRSGNLLYFEARGKTAAQNRNRGHLGFMYGSNVDTSISHNVYYYDTYTQGAISEPTWEKWDSSSVKNYAFMDDWVTGNTFYPLRGDYKVVRAIPYVYTNYHHTSSGAVYARASRYGQVLKESIYADPWETGKTFVGWFDENGVKVIPGETIMTWVEKHLYPKFE